MHESQSDISGRTDGRGRTDRAEGGPTMTKGVQKEGSRSRAGVFTANGVVILHSIALIVPNVHYPVFENAERATDIQNVLGQKELSASPPFPADNLCLLF